MDFEVTFDEVMARKIVRLSKQDFDLFEKLLSKIKYGGVNVGKLLDNRNWIYEVKMKRPSFRIYYTYLKSENVVLILDYHKKKNVSGQQKIINILKDRIQDLRGYIFYFLYSFLLLEVLYVDNLA